LPFRRPEAPGAKPTLPADSPCRPVFVSPVPIADRSSVRRHGRDAELPPWQPVPSRFAASFSHRSKPMPPRGSGSRVHFP
jgi:hypothetical protein